jgi:hypothetical protein
MRLLYQFFEHEGFLRNEGVGDYDENFDGSWGIFSSAMKDPRHRDLILIHEYVETMLIRQAGITNEAILAFDAQFEEWRKQGLVAKDAEPGDDPRAPYYHQHQAATAHEKMLCEQYGIKWEDYEKAIEALYEKEEHACS